MRIGAPAHEPRRSAREAPTPALRARAERLLLLLLMLMLMPMLMLMLMLMLILILMLLMLVAAVSYCLLLLLCRHCRRDRRWVGMGTRRGYSKQASVTNEKHAHLCCGCL